jgi:hypothetical protein
MTNNSIKATSAKINLGFAVIDGLMLPSGEYAIAVPQIADLFQYNPNLASRDLKRLLGEGFSPSKISTDLGKQLINVVSIATFKKIILTLSKQGHPVASSFIDAILEEGLERRFDLAFNQLVDEAERNARIELRMKRIMARHQWTDILMNRHLKQTGVKPLPDDYKRWTVTVNNKLFNKLHFKRNRDNMSFDEQLLIEQFEFMAARVANKFPDLSCNMLLEKTLETF